MFGLDSAALALRPYRPERAHVLPLAVQEAALGVERTYLTCDLVVRRNINIAIGHFVLPNI